MSSNSTQGKVGWRPAEYAAAIGVSRSAFYAIPEGMRPRAVHIAAAHIIVEQPQAYLDRIAKQQLEGSAA
jgi:hypothetical protein